MGQNHLGVLGVPALKTVPARSDDFSFIADGRDKWGLGVLITVDAVPESGPPTACVGAESTMPVIGSIRSAA
jgi:methyl acetate hydrolase